MERELAWETEVLEVNLPHCYFIHHKSHIFCTEIEPRPPTLWHGTADSIFMN
jgi:hypothetical protein